MYPEFIAIYVGLVVLVALGVAILFLLLRLNKNNNDFQMPKQKENNTINTQHKVVEPNIGSNMAFCKKCATQFNASERFCPKC